MEEVPHMAEIPVIDRQGRGAPLIVRGEAVDFEGKERQDERKKH